MGFYNTHVVPRIFDLACGGAHHHAQRTTTCAGLRGNVIEVGFGSGHNIPFYPPAVEAVTGVEPAPVAWRLARKRLGASHTPIHRATIDGRSLPFADASFDSALSTFTLCTIPDVEDALSEIKRVLKPGGAFHFVEHGLAPDTSVQRWQRRIDPWHRRAFGGCHLARDIPALIRAAGFEVREFDRFYQPGAPRYLAAMSMGVADRGD